MKERCFKNGYLILMLLLLGLLTNCKNQSGKESPVESQIPSLDEVSGIWMSTDTMAIEPSIRNFRGQALINRDMTSVSWFVSAPYSGGHHSGTLKINGSTPSASLFRWQPYQALRKGTFDGLDIESSTRMMFENDAIMWTVEISNNQTKSKKVDVDLDMIAYISQYKEGKWEWWYPMPDWNGNRVERRDLTIEDMRKHITNDSLGADIGWPSDEEVLSSEHYKANTENSTVYVRDN